MSDPMRDVTHGPVRLRQLSTILFSEADAAATQVALQAWLDGRDNEELLSIYPSWDLVEILVVYVTS